MRFISKIAIPPGVTTPDPTVDPSLVPLDAVFIVEPALLNTDTAGRKSLVAAEGVTGQKPEVQFWALDDDGFSRVNDFDVATAKWYKLGNPVDLTIGFTTEGPPLPGGRIYAQVTISVAAASVIKIGMAP